MADDPVDPFESMLPHLLAPLAQVMMARGVTMGAANEALKRAFLEAALTEADGALSDSRVSLLTGLHRKDVKRLRAEPDDALPRRKVNATALLISHWRQDAAFQTEAGDPRALARKDGPEGPGFDSLAKRARIDMAASTILQELLDQGLVVEEASGMFRLTAASYVPRAGSPQQMAAFIGTLSAHLTAAAENVMAPQDAPRHLDRALRYSHLSEASIEALQEEARAGALALLERLNQSAHERQRRDQGGGYRGRFVFGTYSLSQPNTDPEEE